MNSNTTKIILKKGKPSEIIFKWKGFFELLEKIEDIYDISYINRIKKEKLSFKSFNSVLKENGL